jgi:SDR family mycofactocin-dependent oxidoreductase
MIDLTGQTALVTGAARGIGRATALALAEAGAVVVVTDLATQLEGVTYNTGSNDELSETVALVEAAGGRATSAYVDVRNYAQLEAAVQTAVKEFGGLDIVVANAGIASWPVTTWQASEEQWRTMIDVVLTGTWNTARAAIPAMLAQGQGGSIVMVGSTAAVKPMQTIGHYAAAKSGLVGLLKSLALELAGASIRVNMVHPGGTATEMTQNPAAEHWQASAPGVGEVLTLPLPITRMEPIDVAYAIRWLCSTEARYMTGSQTVLDAGATLQ